jgi:glutathione S-transferase
MLKIYGVPFSVHTRKVVVAARMKSIPFDFARVVPVIPDTVPPNWREISPAGVIPAIDDDGFVLADSTAIIHYLEKKYPGASLLPADVRAHGSALFVNAWAGDVLFRQVVHPLFQHQVVGPHLRKTGGDATAIARALEASSDAFAYLESRKPGRFLVGEGFSIADLAVFTNLVMFRYLGHAIDARKYPRLQAWFESTRTSSPIAAVLDAERSGVAGVPGLNPEI